MIVKKVAKMDSVSRFLYWMKERHEIHTRRKAGQPRPWTDDEVLQSWFFTNPYREHDKTTVWFRKNVRGPMRNEGGVLFATICFRWFNYIPTGKALKESNLFKDWHISGAKFMLHQIKGKVFTGAYMISGKVYTGLPKIDCVCNLLQPIWDDRKELIEQFEGYTTMQEAHARIMEYQGLGGFMAYEIVCDLRYTYLLRKATDKNTWCNPGPGARRGLNRLLEIEDVNKAIKQGIWQQETVRLLKLAKRRLPLMPKLEMREIEHSMCEWDKYERAMSGEGHMKRRYNGGS